MSAPQRWPFKKGTPAARTTKSRMAVNQRIQQSMLLKKRVAKYTTTTDIQTVRQQVKAACTFDAETISDFRAIDLRLPTKLKTAKELRAEEEEMYNAGIE